MGPNDFCVNKQFGAFVHYLITNTNAIHFLRTIDHVHGKWIGTSVARVTKPHVCLSVVNPTLEKQSIFIFIVFDRRALKSNEEKRRQQ